MEIEEIPQERPYYKGLTIESSCERVTRITVSTKKNRLSNRCRRHAVFKIDGQRLCRQHAGELALDHLIENQKKGENHD